MAPDGRPVPIALAFRRRNALLFQAPTHLADRQAVTSDPLEHLSNHAGLFEHDLVTRLAVSFAATDIPIAVRRSAEDVDRALTGRVQLAAAAAFEDLGPLVLGHHPLNLQQQIFFGCLPQSDD